jgi:steroid delta-isomerase-like uncharacterized protein
MSPEDKKNFVRSFYTSMSRGNVNVIDDLFTDDFIEHEPLPTQTPGREGVKQFFKAMLSAFPDARFIPEAMYVDGDTVIARLTVTGTNQGEFQGMPPTGKQTTVEGIDIVRLANGKFAEHWGVFDNLGLLQQLGVVPAPGQQGR